MPASHNAEPDEESWVPGPGHSWDELWPIETLDTSPFEADLALPTPVLCTPAVAVPEYVITQAETLAVAARLHADHPKLRLALRLIENTGVAKRHLIRPIEETLGTHRLRAPQQGVRGGGQEAHPRRRRRCAGERRAHPWRHRRDRARLLHRLHDAVAHRLDDQRTRVPHGHRSASDRPARLRRGNGGDQQGVGLLPRQARRQRPGRVVRILLAVLPARRPGRGQPALQRPVRRRRRRCRGARRRSRHRGQAGGPDLARDPWAPTPGSPTRSRRRVSISG